ncbi:hypothetical protein BJ878DRAFT_26861 [Calycina marina]|uniref:Zn(2)-C6 fungal-type domain-containing protein n=1 Tax=Calycina marina TaxID=1763456 RepID=A0A9P8CJ35_9HELO|nr:hypothetical protein BJ878DRAFT_26861 [Calycina marina]
MEARAKPDCARRKSEKEPGHTKHKRTRSGCYTCRSRRVKCDEGHPTCERCTKGGRKCVYPDLSTASRKKSIHGIPIEVSESSTDEDDHGEDMEPCALDAIADEDEPVESTVESENVSKSSYYHASSSQSTGSRLGSTRQASETPSLVQDKGASPTPSTEGSVGYFQYQTLGTSHPKGLKPQSEMQQPYDWSHLPQDLQFYLSYFYDHITFLHYSLKYDSGNFLKTKYIETALHNDALLYALVGFSAFQHTLHNLQGKIQDFLKYYNKAVTLLLNSLKRGDRRTDGTILAILQLATIEEFLGDWINLLGHQKAAYQILLELYTPRTVMHSQTSRIILAWYCRFDAFAGLMAGFETVISREWFWGAEQHLQNQIAQDPTNLDWKIEHSFAKMRRIANDMSTVFAKLAKGEINQEQFMSENDNVGRMIASWKNELDPALLDGRYLAMDYPNARILEPGHPFDPYIPGSIFNGPLWAMNNAIIDWHSIDLMHRYKTALMLGTQPGEDISRMAIESCQLYEAIEFYHESPPGTVIALQTSLSIACLFMPRDERYAMWARRKLATIESHGYIYPHAFRTKMSDLFRDRSCMQWWLPNDEGYPPIIRSIRKFWKNGKLQQLMCQQKIFEI